MRSERGYRGGSEGYDITLLLGGVSLELNLNSGKLVGWLRGKGVGYLWMILVD